MAHGEIESLSDGEAALCAAYTVSAGPTERAWDYWADRLRKAEATWS
jgi:hypothetical protein